jgi:SNF2 family DNA or RNA helicase
MGLGKTVQVIVAVKALIADYGFLKALIVAPSALQTNWLQELSVWAPELPYMRVRGDQQDRLASYQLPITIQVASYEQIRMDAVLMKSWNVYDLVILDEAQRVKNAHSSTALACRIIPRRRSWALTGTPLENSVSDIRSLFRFIKPDLHLGGSTIGTLTADIGPFILRRRIRDVISELPDVVDRTIRIDLSSEQRYAYDSVRQSAILVADDHESTTTDLLAKFTALKQVCNFDAASGTSSKLTVLQDLLEECHLSNKKAIVFSHYVDTLMWLSKQLPNSPAVYHGGLTETERDVIIEQFRQAAGAEVLLMSLKAGGVGLNLQFASVVILFDRWWNPATESQAISRVVRIGQRDVVLVYRFVTVDTIEERIESLLFDKEKLFDLNVNKYSETPDTKAPSLRSLIARA